MTVTFEGAAKTTASSQDKKRNLAQQIILKNKLTRMQISELLVKAGEAPLRTQYNE